MTNLTDSFSINYDWRDLAANSRDMIGIHNTEAQFLWVSKAVTDLLGYQPEEIIGLTPYDLMHEEDIAKVRNDAHQPMLEDLFSKREFTMRLRHKQGHYVWLETLARTSKRRKWQGKRNTIVQ